MGSIGETIGKSNDVSAILWCDLTNDTHLFHISFYEKDDNFIGWYDDEEKANRAMESVKDGWADCFGSKSRETQSGTVILQFGGYEIAVKESVNCGMRSLDVMLIKDGEIVEHHDVYEVLPSEHYSKLYNIIMKHNNESREKLSGMRDALTKRLESWAKEHGYRFTPHAPNIIESILKQREKHGDDYCPCRVQKIDDNVCPCIHVHDDIKKKGHCHCLLFEKDDA